MPGAEVTRELVALPVPPLTGDQNAERSGCSGKREPPKWAGPETAIPESGASLERKVNRCYTWGRTATLWAHLHR